MNIIWFGRLFSLIQLDINIVFIMLLTYVQDSIQPIEESNSQISLQNSNQMQTCN